MHHANYEARLRLHKHEKMRENVKRFLHLQCLRIRDAYMGTDKKNFELVRMKHSKEVQCSINSAVPNKMRSILQRAMVAHSFSAVFCC